MLRAATGAFIASILSAGCAASPLPRVELPALTTTDVTVLTATVHALVPRMIATSSGGRFALERSTLVMPLPEPVVARVDGWPLTPGQVAALTLSGGVVTQDLLTPAERAVWRARNLISRQLLPLPVAGLTFPQGDVLPVVHLSAPAFPSDAAAVVYASFGSGGASGEGWLFRLTYDGRTWNVTGARLLWLG